MWREIIKQVGPGRIANAIGMSKYAVLRYEKGTAFPQSGKSMKKLVGFMFLELPQDKFEEFLDSLSQDIGIKPDFTEKVLQ